MRIVGLSMINILIMGKIGDGGIQQVINKIYNLNKEKILNNFIKEAINKIRFVDIIFST